MTNEKTTQKLMNLQKLPQFRGSVHSKNNIRNLPNVKLGEIFWVENDEKPYVVIEKKKKGDIVIAPLDWGATLSSGLSLYELAKAATRAEKPIEWSEETVEQHSSAISKWAKEGDEKFYMFYGRAIHSFTLFQKVAEELSGESVLETIRSFGDVVSIDLNTNGRSIEFWIKIDGDPELFYLFPFDKAVISA